MFVANDQLFIFQTLSFLNLSFLVALVVRWDSRALFGSLQCCQESNFQPWTPMSVLKNAKPAILTTNMLYLVLNNNALQWLIKKEIFFLHLVLFLFE